MLDLRSSAVSIIATSRRSSKHAGIRLGCARHAGLGAALVHHQQVASVCRFYMLANKIEFEERLVDFATWGGGEKERVKAAVNPLGHLPVTTVDGRDRPESVATLRYMATKVCFYPLLQIPCRWCSNGGVHQSAQLARTSQQTSYSLQIGQYGKNSEADWDSDAAADAYQEWRNSWATTLREDEASDKVQAYRQGRDDWFSAFDWYYSQRTATDSPYLAPGAPATHHSCSGVAWQQRNRPLHRRAALQYINATIARTTVIVYLVHAQIQTDQFKLFICAHGASLSFFTETHPML